MLRRLTLSGALLLAIAAVTATSAPSFGQSYIAGAIGPNFATSMVASGGSAQVDTATGPFGHLDLGWMFGNGFRSEIEGEYGSSSIGGISTQRLNGLRAPLTDTSGSLGTPAVMFNVAYDIAPDRFGWTAGLPFRPYIGAGVGYAWLDFGGAGGDETAVFHLPSGNTFTGSAAVRLGTGEAFAYQAFAGAALPIAAAPGLEATLEYRYFGTARAGVPATATSLTPDLVNGSVPSGSKRFGFVVGDNMLLVGLRYRFAAP